MIGYEEYEIVKRLHAKLSKQGISGGIPTAIYARKSSNDTSGLSVQSQVDFCKEYISSIKELDLVATFQEDDVTGTNNKRSEYQKLLNSLKSKEVYIVVVYRLNRISRGQAVNAEYETILKQNGGLVLSVTQNFTYTADGIHYKRTVQADDEKMAIEASENTMRQLTATAKQGRNAGGCPPLGYKLVSHRYVVDESEASAVRFIFDSVVGGLSYTAIAKELKSNGYKTKKGNDFTKESLNAILTNEKYTGLYLWNREGGKKKPDRVLVTHFDEVRVENGVPAIITKEKFALVQSILKIRSQRVATGNGKTQYPLTGLLVCANCGQSLHGSTKHAGRSLGNYRTYVCNSNDNGNHKCSTKSVNADYLEKAIANTLYQIVAKEMSKPSMVKKTFKKISDDLGLNLRSLLREQARINLVKKDTIIALGRAPSEMVPDINEQLRNLKELEETTQASIDFVNSRIQNVTNCTSKIKSQGLPFSAKDIADDKYLLRSLAVLFIEQIKVDENDIVIELKNF